MRLGLLLALLAGTLAAGCERTPLDPGGAGMHEKVDVPANVGELRLRLSWPAREDRQVQGVPAASERADFVVRDSLGTPVATRSMLRPVDPAVTLSFALPPQEGYTAVITLYDGDDAPVAKGESVPFSILLNQVEHVELTANPLIATYAGSGKLGFSGDGAAATLAAFSSPWGLGVDLDGALLVADRSNQRIRRIDSTGVIATFIGSGQRSLDDPANRIGNGLSAAATPLYWPSDVAVTRKGDVLVTDTQNRALRILPAKDGERYGKQLTAGLMQTIHTSETRYMFDLATDAQGNVFWGEGDRLMMLTPAGELVHVAGNLALPFQRGADGPALESALNLPDGLLADAYGNLIFSERGNHRVRLLCRQPGTYFGLPMASGSVYTIAGVGEPTSLNFPLGDGGDGLKASLTYPRGIAMDARGNLYVADGGNERIRRLDPGRIMTTVIGTGEPTSEDASPLGDGGLALKATLSQPIGLVVSDGWLYVADAKNQRIRRIRL